MTLALDILGGIGLWILFVIVVLSLMRAAADADRGLGYKAPTSPLADEIDRWNQAKERLRERGIL